MIYSCELQDQLQSAGIPERFARIGRARCPACGEHRAFVRPSGWVVCNRRNACGFVGRLENSGARRRGPRPAVQSGHLHPPRVRPPTDELIRWWEASQPLFGAGDTPRDLEAWQLLRSKGIDPLEASTFGLVRLAPRADALRVSWWPAAWRTHRLVVPAFEIDGTFASVHARAVGEVPRGEPKTRWPVGCAASGLLFATPPTRKLLGGSPEIAAEVSQLLFVEGLTDFLAAALDAIVCSGHGLRRAVLGITSGSLGALKRLRIPPRLPVLIATDADDAGDRYAAAIATALPQHGCRRVRLGSRDLR